MQLSGQGSFAAYWPGRPSYKGCSANSIPSVTVFGLGKSNSLPLDFFLPTEPSVCSGGGTSYCCKRKRLALPTQPQGLFAPPGMLYDTPSLRVGGGPETTTGESRQQTAPLSITVLFMNAIRDSANVPLAVSHPDTDAHGRERPLNNATIAEAGRGQALAPSEPSI